MDLPTHAEIRSAHPLGRRSRKAARQNDCHDRPRTTFGRNHVRHLARRLALRAFPSPSTCSFVINKTLGANHAPGVIKTAERKLSRVGDRVGPGLRLELLRCSMHSEAAIAARRWISTYASRTRILDSRQLVARSLLWHPLEVDCQPKPHHLAPPTRLPLTVGPPHTRGRDRKSVV